MFWSQDEIPSVGTQARLRQELRERLRLVAEFATLGAYELTGSAGHEDAPHARGGEPTRRMFLFTRVPETRCAHSPETPRACPATRTTRPTRASQRRMPRRRAGVESPQQPCTWFEVETAPATRRPPR
jgi:hypothetical protein